MAAINTSVEIERTPEEVFAYLADLSRQIEWQESLVSATVETDGPTRVGTRVTHRRQVGPRIMESTSEITAYDPPRLLSFRTLDGPIRARGSGRVEPTQSGSRVNLELDFSGRGLGKLMLPMVRRQAARQVVTDHQKLKEILESRAH